MNEWINVWMNEWIYTCNWHSLILGIHSPLSRITLTELFVQDICTWCSSPSDTTCTVYILIYQYTAKISMYRTLCTWIFVLDAPHRPIQPVQFTYSFINILRRSVCTGLYVHEYLYMMLLTVRYNLYSVQCTYSFINILRRSVCTGLYVHEFLTTFFVGSLI